ncbi:MAG: ATP-binding cassette domain-containing protein [Capnocytophaga sp.]|nr:ATP-binding cassette domain-containing protein [Capnocytophaga sp.]
MLQINILEKKFGEKIIFENLNIHLEKNGLYGVVGKNGSGKTTFFKCLSYLTDFQGNILYKKKENFLDKIAFIPTEPYLYDYLSIKEFYKFYSLLLNISSCKSPFFQLETSLLIKDLSTGMRKKCYINAVFQKEYEIYIFDEPFNGLDMESVYELQKKIKELAKKHIVFISSHILEILNDCDFIFMFKDKKVSKILPENYSNIKTLLLE